MQGSGGDAGSFFAKKAGKDLTQTR
jgi:hypothetical protein